ncbi:MAG: PKD domain-containing protein, partial [Verrucomicrobiia bacterium]
MSVPRCIAMVVLMLLAGHVGRASASTTYNVIDLGTLGGISSQAKAINVSGQIVGSATAASESAYYAAFWTNSSSAAIDLGTLGGTSSQANGINSAGQMVGWAFLTGDTASHAALWTNSSNAAIDLGTLGGTSSQANGINSAGQMVGWADLTNNTASHAALWTNSNNAAIDLGTLGGTSSQANGINDSGQIVGFAYTTSNTASHAALWTNGSSAAIDLGTLGGTFSQANGINDSGQIVGSATAAGDSAYHATLWTNSSSAAVDLGTLGGTACQANGINSAGQMVGWAFLTNNTSHAFLWTSTTSPAVDLNTLIPTNSGWVLSYPYAINDSGVIVGYGTISGNIHAFALIPVPSTAPVANLIATPTNGVAPLGVTFTDTSTGGTNWSWTFGDGGTTNLATNSVYYTYNTPGVYSVTDVVSGPGGSGTDTVANYITVLTPLPVASFTASPTSGAAPLNVGFTDQSSGSVTGWAW